MNKEIDPEEKHKEKHKEDWIVIGQVYKIYDWSERKIREVKIENIVFRGLENGVEMKVYWQYADTVDPGIHEYCATSFANAMVVAKRFKRFKALCRGLASIAQKMIDKSGINSIEDAFVIKTRAKVCDNCTDIDRGRTIVITPTKHQIFCLDCRKDIQGYVYVDTEGAEKAKFSATDFLPQSINPVKHFDSGE